MFFVRLSDSLPAHSQPQAHWAHQTTGANYQDDAALIVLIYLVLVKEIHSRANLFVKHQVNDKTRDRAENESWEINKAGILWWQKNILM